MAQPRGKEPGRRVTTRQHQQHQQQQTERYQQQATHGERDHNNNEVGAQTDAQANQPSVIDLCTADTMVGREGNIMNAENEIRASLTMNISADPLNNVNDVLVLHYGPHNNNNNHTNNNSAHTSIGDSELVSFNGIHNRNNACNSNSIHQSYLPPRSHEMGCDNAQSGMIQFIRDHGLSTQGYITFNPVVGIDESVLAALSPEAEEEEERAGNQYMEDGAGDGIGVGAGDGGVATPDDITDDVDDNANILHETHSGLIAVHLNHPDDMPIQTDGNELMAQAYFEPNNVRRNRRRHRRGRGRPLGENQQRYAIRQSLKSMNKILRKTAYTLRRIRSLITQQVQLTRNLHQTSVPMSL